MREYNRPSNALFVLLSAAVFSVGCADKKANDTALTADSTLGRDLAMAARDTTVQPQLKDVPVTPPPAPVAEAKPAPVVPRSYPKPRPRETATPVRPRIKTAPPVTAPTPTRAAEAVTGTVAAGTTLSFTSNSKVCTNTNAVGDKFTANLADNVPATNGASIPSGAVGTFEVTELKTARNSNDKTYLTVRLLNLQFGGKTYAVESTLQTAATQRVRASGSDDAKKVAGGAIIGAIIGQIIGKNTKGTVIGGAAGAAAGTAAAVATADYETCLNGGGSVVVKLDAPATIRMATAN